MPNQECVMGTMRNGVMAITCDASSSAVNFSESPRGRPPDGPCRSAQSISSRHRTVYWQPPAAAIMHLYESAALCEGAIFGPV
jgi:hypothetical protein